MQEHQLWGARLLPGNHETLPHPRLAQRAQVQRGRKSPVGLPASRMEHQRFPEGHYEEDSMLTYVLAFSLLQNKSTGSLEAPWWSYRRLRKVPHERMRMASAWSSTNFLPTSDQIRLRLDGFQCAGAVQFSTDGENYSGYICSDGWGKTCASAQDPPEKRGLFL